MADISKTKTLDWSNVVPSFAPNDLLAFLDQRSFEYFNAEREKSGRARITAEEWEKLKCR